jgi:hypothetical protein
VSQPQSSAEDHPALSALRFYLVGVGAQGRLPLYQRLLESAIDDFEAGGVFADLLADPGRDPIESAVPLRLLGAVHRLVLIGEAADLAAFYPSVGGTYDPETSPDPGPVFVETVAEHRDTVAAGLARHVQTNEVGRSNGLVVGFLHIAEITGLPMRLLEIGSSAGLNLRWDRFHYAGGAGGVSFGPVDSPVRLGDVYRAPPPRFDRIAVVLERRGCDTRPLDPLSTEDQLTLRSFMWPEQEDRRARLDAALNVARGVPAPVDRADAGLWLDQELAEDAVVAGTATVVFHSITWQYMAASTRARVMAALMRAGRSATADSPLAWLRMEPAAVGAGHTEVRVTLWPGGHDQLVGRCGYHGQWVQAVELAGRVDGTSVAAP